MLTHGHSDHVTCLPVMLEAMHEDLHFKEPKGALVAPQEYVNSQRLDPFYLSLVASIFKVEPGSSYNIFPGISLTATSTRHGTIQNCGFRMEVSPNGASLGMTPYGYQIGFTSDTAEFPAYIDQYKGCDVLVANILRPDRVTCRGHLSIDEFIPLLVEISPKICVVTHFGAMMVNSTVGNLIEPQMDKIRRAVGESTVIIGATDGLRVSFQQAWKS